MARIEAADWLTEIEGRLANMTDAEKADRLAEIESQRAEIRVRMKEHGGMMTAMSGGAAEREKKIDAWWTLTAEMQPLDEERSRIVNPGLYGPVETDGGVMLAARFGVEL